MPAEGSLTDRQIELFHRNGFLVLPDRLPAERVERLRAAIDHDIENEVEPVVRDDDGTVGRISNVIDRDPVFWEAITDPLVLDPLESLLGPNIEVLKNRHNHATLRRRSDTEGATYFHRDVRQWSRPIVTVLYYLTGTDLENGCTRVIPGSHGIPSAELRTADGDGWRQEGPVFGQEVPVPMPEGGLLAINSLLLHRVGMNHTDEPRTSMTIGYHSVDELSNVDDPNRRLARGERIYAGHDY